MKLRSVAPYFFGLSLLMAQLAVGQTGYPNNTIVSRMNDTTGNCSSDTPIQGTQNVVVGQPIKITGCAPQGGPTGQLFIETNSWTGATIAGFSVTEDDKQNFKEVITENLGPSCTVAPTCDYPKFYFVLPGDYSLIYRGAGTTDASLSFHVMGPTPDAKGDFMTWAEVFGTDTWSTLNPPPPADPIYPSKVFLGLGTATIDGIRFSVTGQPPMASGGWQFVQLLKEEPYSFLTAKSQRNYATPEGLDTVYPYSHTTPLYPSPPTGASDSSGLYLDLEKVVVNGKAVLTPEGAAAENFNAKMYLLWDPGIPRPGDQTCTIAGSRFAGGVPSYFPSTCDSIPVPVQSLLWGWCAQAAKTLNSGQMNDHASYAESWHVTKRCYQPVQTGEAGYPIWSFTSGAGKATIH